MEEGVVLGLLAAGVLVGAALIAHRRNAAREAERLHHLQTAYHGVAIQPGEGSCASAELLRGIRFLAREAPALPLKSCGGKACRCVYLHFDDRRHHNRRDMYLNKVYLAPEELVERRNTPSGRRKTDHPWPQPAH